MLALLLPLLSSSHAGEIQIQASSPVLITVDGQMVDFPEGQIVGTALDLAGGRHEVRVTTVKGELLAEETYDLKFDHQLRLKYANRAIREIGRGRMPNMPEPALVESSVTTTTETVDVHMGVPGMHVDISINEGGNFDPVEGRAPPVNGPPPPLEPVAMGPQDFGRLAAAVDGESFSDDQLDLIRTAANHSWFNIDQTVALLEHLSFSSDKLKALEILRPRIVDPQNSHQLNEAFTFSSDKEAAQEMFR